MGRPSGLDTFDSANNWTLFDNACFKSEITGGFYAMSAKGLPQVSCWEVSWPVIQNYYAETLVQMPATCQAEDRFGLFFRSPDNLSGYLYGLSCDGRYSMTAWDGQTTTVLVEPVANAAILTGPGQANRLGVVASGGTYALYANGTLLQVLQDYTYAEAGRLGYFVRAATETGFVVQYDSLALWLLEPLVPGSTTGDLASSIATSVACYARPGRYYRSRRNTGGHGFPYSHTADHLCTGVYAHAYPDLLIRRGWGSLGDVQPAGCGWKPGHRG